MKAYYTADPNRPTDAPVLVCQGTERACRQAAAQALGRNTLRGCPQAASERGVYYYAHADDAAPSVELVY